MAFEFGSSLDFVCRAVKRINLYKKIMNVTYFNM